MNMKKIFLFLFVFCIIFSVSAADKDVVLVLDTSSAMFSYYNETGTFLSGRFLAENLQTGDTLHIISFGAKPRLEIARRIMGAGDIETVGARIWLLYPLEPDSDPAAALNFAEQYVRSIQGGRSKKVFVVSGNDLSSQVRAAAGRFRPAELTFIRAGSSIGQRPAAPPRQAAPGQAAASDKPAAGSAAGGAASVSASGGPAAADPGVITDAGSIQAGEDKDPDDQLIPDITGNKPGGESTGTGASQDGTGSAGTGSTGTGGLSDTSGTAGIDQGTGYSGQSGFDIPLPYLIGGALLLLLLVLLFIIFRMRNLHSSPKKAMAQLSGAGNAARDAELLNSFASRQAEAALQGPHRQYHRDNSGQLLTAPTMLNLFVEEQNAGIGRRNIHALKKGASYTVGGGNSDFKIFLVHFPPNIGRFTFDGTNGTFTPLRSEFFPDIGSSRVTECIGKTIRLLSKKNYEVFFRFEPYKDPLILMNQLLNSIRVPEPPLTG